MGKAQYVETRVVAVSVVSASVGIGIIVMLVVYPLVVPFRDVWLTISGFLLGFLMLAFDEVAFRKRERRTTEKLMNDLNEQIARYDETVVRLKQQVAQYEESLTYPVFRNALRFGAYLDQCLCDFNDKKTDTKFLARLRELADDLGIRQNLDARLEVLTKSFGKDSVTETMGGLNYVINEKHGRYVGAAFAAGFRISSLRGMISLGSKDYVESYSQRLTEALAVWIAHDKEVLDHVKIECENLSNERIGAEDKVLFLELLFSYLLNYPNPFESEIGKRVRLVLAGEISMGHHGFAAKAKEILNRTVVRPIVGPA